MGSESSKSESNSSKSDSESSSSGKENCKLEIMICRKENQNKIINRVWIVKKSISLNDGHINLNGKVGFLTDKIYNYVFRNKVNLKKPLKNVFNIKNKFNSNCKHWAIILELSNDSYVNIQFGRSGFSLEEFNKTDIEGENILNSIVCTWGEDGSPFSFCYLGKTTNYKYDDLKKELLMEKIKEIKSLEENGKINYNVCFSNCQHFVCDIEKTLFGYIKSWHSFDYYLDEFYNYFFPNINLNKLKEKYERELHEKNEELFKLNFQKIKEMKINSKSLFGFKGRYAIKRIKEEVEELFSMKFDD